MVKSIITMSLVAIILLVGSLYEQDFVKRQFQEFTVSTEQVYEKIENESATENDIYALQENWLNKKSYLHIFIPHNEIKEMELWLSETVKLVKNEMWEDALSKIEVLKELSEQIPKTFTISIGNIL